MEKYKRYKLTRNNDLVKLVKRLPIDTNNYNNRWNARELCRNPCMTFKNIIKLVGKVDFYYVSQNPNINIDIVVKYIKEQWDWDALSENPGIKPADILKYPGLPWNFKYVSKNTSITINFVLKYPSEVFDREELLKNLGIPAADLRQLRLHPYEEYKLNRREDGLILNNISVDTLIDMDGRIDWLSFSDNEMGFQIFQFDKNEIYVK